MAENDEPKPAAPDDGATPDAARPDAPKPDTAKPEAPKPDDKDAKPDAKPPPPRAKWPWVVGGMVIVGFIVVVLLILYLPRSWVRTNDAYVAAHSAMVAPRVSGQVTAVLIDDNQPVAAGQLVLTIDDRDYRATLAQAEGTLAGDLAQVDQSRAQVTRQPALIAQARARIGSAQARLAVSALNAKRYANLAATGAASVQQQQETAATLRQDEAALVTTEADLVAAERQLDAARANLETARARVLSDRAAVVQAKLNVGYTRVVAPIRGTVDQRSVQIGDQLTAGRPAMIVVPLDDVYVDANYRELALRHMAPGQAARIHVDAYDIWLNGVVQGLGAASGTSFSPIPPNNATGNFTKIVQRLPVRIHILPGQALARLLRVGMSVEVEVDTGLHDVVAAQRGADYRVTQAVGR